MKNKLLEKEDVNRTIEIPAKQHQTALEASTEFLLKPTFLAAKIIDSDKKQLSKDFIDLQYTQAMLERSIGDIKAGNLTDIETILYSQAYALNAMFATLMTRANRQEYMPTTQALMALAFKAQNQSRSTIQALIDLKLPKQPTFVKQTNIAQGHQQITNLTEKNLNLQNELLENRSYDLDSKPKTKAKRVDSNLEAVEEIYRSKNRGRKSKGI